MLAQYAVATERLINERRAHRRFTASELRGLRTARVKYGREVSVIDLSEGGVLFETGGELKPDSTIVLEFGGLSRTFLVPSRVVRCQDLGTFENNPRLKGACAFRRRLPLDELVGDAPHRESPVTKVINRAAATLAGWQHVVGQYRDGRIVRGYTNDFSASRPVLHISPAPFADETKFVSLIQLDAVFFLSSLQAPAIETPDTVPAAGRKVAVTLPDGRELVGTTLTYRSDGCGFFVRPLDPQAGAARVFITQSGIRNVRFL